MCSIIDGLWDIMLAPLLKEMEQPTAQQVVGASEVGTTEGRQNEHRTDHRRGWLKGMVPVRMVRWSKRMEPDHQSVAKRHQSEPADEGGS